MNILIMGGTRFVGKAIVKGLLLKQHTLTLFTRGNKPVPDNVEHIKGDRENEDDLSALNGKSFDVIIDSSGRSEDDTKLLLAHSGKPKHRFIYISSAGVYKDSIFMPLDEQSPIDPNSRHYGKFMTEKYLINNKIPFTSFRPTYIYGAGNYNPIEKWFFDRITQDQIIPIPYNGETITQLGHVNDLSDAIIKSLDLSICVNKIYNCSGKKAVTFRGLAELSALVCGKNTNELKFRSFDPERLDKKSRKLFPLRINNFYTDITLMETEIEFSPQISLLDGLKDNFLNDYSLKTIIKTDFTNDQYLK